LIDFENSPGEYPTIQLYAHKFHTGDIVQIREYHEQKRKSHQKKIFEENTFEALVLTVKESKIVLSINNTEDHLPSVSKKYWIVKLSNSHIYTRMYDTITKLKNMKDIDMTLLTKILLGREKPSQNWTKDEIDSPISNFSLFDNTLNHEQKDAVEFALASKEIAVIHGPPGTGKTSTLIEIIRQLVFRNQRLLICGPSNISVVLSIRTALSIQAHPDHALAVELHHKYPDYYKDSNHKPEMAIALTSFEALCGFRPLNEILSFIRSVKALHELLGDTADTLIKEMENIQTESTINHRSILQKLLWTLLTQSKTHVEKCAEQLIIEIYKNKLFEKESTYEVIIRLNEQFPKDIGLFCVFLLNHIRLEPGEGIFLQANTPHAYLCGEIVECMSSSDNVVRAGLTPKFKDIETFVSMLTYECSPASAQKMTPIRFDRTIGDGDVYLFKPPIDEFSVLQIHLKKGHIQTIEGLNGPSIMICTKGEATLHGAGEKYLYNEKFDVVLIDEASQALEAQSWIPLINVQKVILAGDHLQLSPIIKTKMNTDSEKTFSISLFERILRTHGNDIKRLLRIQYRMHKAICKFPSDELYEGALIPDQSVENILLKDLDGVDDTEGNN
ncbi:hypothetical protein PCK2_000869, partial [Pneumocystis canis]